MNRRGWLRWAAHLAWRESRGGRARLFLVIAAVSIGIATIVASGAFRAAIDRSLSDQARQLLGADVVVESRSAFTPGDQEFFKSLSGHTATEVRFNSMVSVPANGTTAPRARLVQVRSIDGDFPFYGRFVTRPADAMDRVRAGEGVAVEESVLLQLGLHLGDRLRLGRLELPIVGTLGKIPGESMVTSLFAPRIYIPSQRLHDTALLQTGSLFSTKWYWALDPARAAQTDFANDVKQRLHDRAPSTRWEIETPASRQRSFGRAATNLSRFLNFIGAALLLLGAVGVLGALAAYAAGKVDNVGTLRCLGAPSRWTLCAYLLQAGALGLLGALLGTAAGLILAASLPLLLKDFLPLPISFVFTPIPVIEGFVLGLVVAGVAAGIPLARLGRVSPLEALRTTRAGIASRSERWLKKIVSDRWPYAWRIAASNLLRPGNQTRLLLTTLGVGTGLLLTIALTHRSLLQSVSIGGGPDQATLAMFDVQEDQVPAVQQLLKAQSAPTLQSVPIVTMRLLSVAGRTVEEMTRQPKRYRTWALNREYRSTYRNRLDDSETIVAGAWHGNRPLPNGPAPISMEKDIADDIGAHLGDIVVFDVQGVSVETRVTSLRRVEWYRMKPNFFVVFPEGVLEAAPKTFVITTRAANADATAKIQAATLAAFPNVSILDLSMVIETVDAFLSKIAAGLRFITGFAIATGLLVLASSVAGARRQRLADTALLRAMGAARGLILKINAGEFFLLGGLSSGIGVVLGIAGGYSLCRFVFHVSLRLAVIPLLTTPVAVIALTMATAFLAERRIFSSSPLESLRAEGS